MRTLLKAIFFVLLVASMAGCSTNFFNYDKSSSDPQVQYGGDFRVRAQATRGVNQ